VEFGLWAEPFKAAVKLPIGTGIADALNDEVQRIGLQVVPGERFPQFDLPPGQRIRLGQFTAEPTVDPDGRFVALRFRLDLDHLATVRIRAAEGWMEIMEFGLAVLPGHKPRRPRNQNGGSLARFASAEVERYDAAAVEFLGLDMPFASWVAEQFARFKISAALTAQRAWMFGTTSPVRFEHNGAKVTIARQPDKHVLGVEAVRVDDETGYGQCFAAAVLTHSPGRGWIDAVEAASAVPIDPHGTGHGIDVQQVFNHWITGPGRAPGQGPWNN
jgi:hypothetical protein